MFLLFLPVFVHSIFCMAADKTAEVRNRNVQAAAGTRSADPGQVSAPPPPPPRRAMRDGSSTLHALPPLVLRQLPQDMDTVSDFRGILYLHLCADKCLVRKIPLFFRFCKKIFCSRRIILLVFVECIWTGWTSESQQGLGPTDCKERRCSGVWIAGIIFSIFHMEGGIVME